MADNPRKKGLDRQRVSQQPHEQAYQRRKKKQQEGNSGRQRDEDRGQTAAPRNSGSRNEDRDE